MQKQKKTIKIRETKISIIEIIIVCMILLFTGSVFLLNFHSKAFVNFDMYSDMRVASLMFQEKTFFPENWIFGNQIYVGATPVLAAILYGVFQDSFIAMAAASCLMMLFILVAFLWCVKPIGNRFSMLLGGLCISGGCILATSAATDPNGFQLFYTMASYYSCYLIGILLVMGVWIRLRSTMRCNCIVLAASIVLCFALGMNSPREMLVLCIPLLILECILILFEWSKNGTTFPVLLKRRSFIYTVAVAGGNFAGMVLIRMLDIPQNHIAETGVGAGNIVQAIRALLQIAGGYYIQQGVKKIPLAILSVLLIVVVLSALYKIIKHKDLSKISLAILFCVLSLLCIFLAGVFMIRLRAIYYFPWYLLTALSVIYLAENSSKRGKRNLIATIVCIGAMINYTYNFYPDWSRYQKYDEFYAEVAQDLEAQGINTIYMDSRTCYQFIPSVYVKDAFLTVCFHFRPEAENSNEMVLKKVNYIQEKNIWKEGEMHYLLLSDATWSSFEISRNDAEAKVDLELLKKYEHEGKQLYLYVTKTEFTD